MEIYYYHMEGSNIVYWSTRMINTLDLIYLGSSDNPNKKMAMAVFTKDLPVRDGWTLKEYPF